MSQDRTYYRAEGRTLERVKEWQEAEKAAHEKVVAFAKRLGASEAIFYSDPYSIGGLVFKGFIPKGWRLGKNGGWWPKQNSAEGKALYKEMRSIGGKRLDPLLGATDLMIVGRYMMHCTLEQIGGAWYVGVPNTNEGEPFFIPEDAVPLKMSEYWALKEAEAKA